MAGDCSEEMVADNDRPSTLMDALLGPQTVISEEDAEAARLARAAERLASGDGTVRDGPIGLLAGGIATTSQPEGEVSPVPRLLKWLYPKPKPPIPTLADMIEEIRESNAGP
jgi:hypothetical protein